MTNTKRMNITISDELMKVLDEYSNRYGMSKSALCSFVIGQWSDRMARADNKVCEDILEDISLAVEGKDGR